MPITDFPKAGGDKKVSLRNSEYPQFDYDFAVGLKENNNDVWRMGGNIRGNEAFEFWTKAREGQETEGTIDWIREREAWAARHFEDGAQFKDGDLEPNASNIGGVIAQIKWGVVGTLGEQGMKDVVLEMVKKTEGKKDRQLSDAVITGLENMRDEHNEEHGDDPTKRVTLSMLETCFERGLAAYQNNPGSVRPAVMSAQQWAYARCRSFLFAVRNERFQGGKHDTDLFPDGHPLQSDDEESRGIDLLVDFNDSVTDTQAEQVDDMEQEHRHIQNITQTDDTIVITFAKIHDDDMDMDMEESGNKPEEERISRADIVQRSYHMDEEDRFIDEDNRLVRVGVSSEMPVQRDFGMEVIDHSRDHMNLEFLNSGRAPLLLDHDMDKMIGQVVSVELDESARRLRAVVRFSKNALAEEVFRDVLDGIRQNISVGYRIDERIHHDDDEEDIVRVATTPLEVSLVSIPADMSESVGVGRSASPDMTRSDPMSEVDLEVVKAEAVKAARKNDSEILSLAAKHSRRDLGENAIRDGLTVDQFRGTLLDAIGDKPLENPAAVDAPMKELRSYTIGGAVRDIAKNGRLTGIHAEVQDELARKTGRSIDSNAFQVPSFAWRAGALSTAATGAVGDENVTDSFVQTTVRDDMFIEALRPHMVLSNLGATFMSGLTGRIQMPKFSAGANAGFVEELGDVTDQSQTDASVTLTPRTIGAFVDISRLMSLEVPQIDQIVRNDMLASIANKIEEAAIQGSGSSGNPTGILSTSGVNDLDISADTDVAALTWQDIIDLVKLVEEDNGVVNAAALGFLTNAKVKSKLASTVRVASTDSVFLLNDPWNNLYGYPIEFTNNVPSNLNPGDGGTDASALIFGDFSQLMIGTFFGGPSITVDMSANSLAGSTRLIMHQEVDVAVRNAVSFAITNEVSTA